MSATNAKPLRFVPPDWTEIQTAVRMFREGTTVKQIKGGNWTVYRTASCIRIDIAIATEGESVHA